jgi:hypothetical protein
MSALAQFPNQPHLWGHADFVSAHVRAEKRLGRPILLNNVKGPLGEYLAAWRGDASTRHLWNLWLAGRGNPASNPDTGPRTHSRGTGADYWFYTAAERAALTREGIVFPVKGEPWHGQLANATAYPLITSNTRPLTNGLGQLITPAKRKAQRMDLLIVRNSQNGAIGAVWKIGEETVFHPITADEWKRVQAAGSLYIDVAGAYFNELQTKYRWV